MPNKVICGDCSVVVVVVVVVVNFSYVSSFSPEPHGQFQPNLAQSILERRKLKFGQMKGHTLFQGEIITK